MVVTVGKGAVVVTIVLPGSIVAVVVVVVVVVAVASVPVNYLVTGTSGPVDSATSLVPSLLKPGTMVLIDSTSSFRFGGFGEFEDSSVFFIFSSAFLAFSSS